MKVAVYYSPNDVRVEERPIPRIGSDEILVKMKACGICGSDLMEWYLEQRVLLVLGHEPTGIVSEVGRNVNDFKPGDRVFVHHHVACLICHYCTHGDYTLCEQFKKTHIFPGGFAEYFRVPALNLKIDTLKIPDELSFEEATLIEPVACCLRALTKCDVRPGDTVAIIGAGPSGVIHTMISKILGAGQVIVSDIINYRLEIAEKFGADLVVNPQEERFASCVREATYGRGADTVIVTVPSIEALSEGIDACRRGGTVCIFAPTSPKDHMQISPGKLFFSEIKLVSSYSTSHIETRMALQLIRSKRIRAKELITHRFPLRQIMNAFETARRKNCLKVVVLG